MTTQNKKGKLPKAPDGFRYIFRASKTLPSGEKIYAKDYGLRGFPILVPIKK